MAKAEIPEKLNICITAQKFPILGRVSDYGYLWPIAQGLVKKGHTVTVLSSQSPQRKPIIEKDGVTAFYLKESHDPAYPWNFSKELEKKFQELHNEKPFNIVHSIDASGLPISLKYKKYKIATAFDVESTQIAQIFAILGMSQETFKSMIETAINVTYKYLRTYFAADRKLLKTANGVFVASPRERIVLERYYNYPDARIHTVPYGIEMAQTDKKDLSGLMQELNITEDNQVVVTTSDMKETHEITNLLKAFEKVAIKKPDARLIILGHGPKRKEIEYDIYNLALGSKVILSGAVKNTEIADYISLSHVFVDISSRTSGFEPSLLEAMLQQKVIIGSEVSAIAAIVEDGVDGFLVRPADIQSISELVIDIFSGYKNSDEIGKSGQWKVSQLFDTDNMVQTTIDAYKTILKHSSFYKGSVFSK